MADLKISELPLRTRAPGEASSADPGPGAAVQVRTSSRAATSSAWRSVERRPRAGSAVQVRTSSRAAHVERLASVERRPRGRERRPGRHGVVGLPIRHTFQLSLMSSTIYLQD